MKRTLLTVFLFTIALCSTAQFDDNAGLFYNGGNSSSTNNVYNGKGGFLGDLSTMQVGGQVFEDISVISGKAPSTNSGATITGRVLVDPGNGLPRRIPVGGGVVVLSLLGVAYIGIKGRQKQK